jgi:Spy/CpxP family protein refolding chaperone
MEVNRYLVLFVGLALVVSGLVGCKPRMDTMVKAEKIFVKMVDKTAGKLNLSEDQKAKLEGLKQEIRKNFQAGQKEKKEALAKIKEEGMKENPDIGKMTALLQKMLQDETRHINQAFDLMVGFRNNLNEEQKKKLNQMTSDWVKKWD